MQTQARISLECLMIKSFVDNALSSEELGNFQEILKEFSTDGKKAYTLLDELIKTKTYDENYYHARLFEILRDDFLKVFLQSSKVADITPLIYKYVEYIRLDKQEALAEDILEKTRNFRVIEFNQEYFERVKYSGVRKQFSSFLEAEQSLGQSVQNSLYATGVEFLDTAFNGGLRGGQLILVSGDYEAGKTTLTTQILENMTMRYKTCFFCFEFTLEAYIMRKKLQPNPLFKKENMIVINDGYDISEIKDNIMRLNEEQGISIFLIDSQMRVENNHTKVGNGEEKESEKFEILGKLALDLKLIIFFIIQTSKGDPNSPFKSKKGGHEASIIIHLQNIDDNKNPFKQFAKRQLKVKKNKQTGKHFEEIIFLDTKTGLFIKDPEHTFKDKSYNAKEAIANAGVTVIDLDSIPLF